MLLVYSLSPTSISRLYFVTSLRKIQIFPQIWKGFLAFFWKYRNGNFVIFVHGEKDFSQFICKLCICLFVFNFIQAWNKDKGFPNYCQIDFQRVWSQRFVWQYRNTSIKLLDFSKLNEREFLNWRMFQAQKIKTFHSEHVKTGHFKCFHMVFFSNKQNWANLP